jgi:protein TIF31
MIQIAEKLHLDDNIHVLDGKGIKKRVAISPDIKGIMGSNNKRYILDLLRMSPRDMNYP